MRSLRTRALRSSAEAEARAREGIDLADLARLARGGGGGEEQMLDLVARARRPAQQQTMPSTSSSRRVAASSHASGASAEPGVRTRFRSLRSASSPSIAVSPRSCQSATEAGLRLEGRAAEPGASTPPKLGAPIAAFKNFVISQIVLRQQRWRRRHAPSRCFIGRQNRAPGGHGILATPPTEKPRSAVGGRRMAIAWIALDRLSKTGVGGGVVHASGSRRTVGNICRTSGAPGGGPGAVGRRRLHPRRQDRRAGARRALHVERLPQGAL